MHLDRDPLRQWSATDGSAEEVISRFAAHDRNKPCVPDEQLIWVWAAIQVRWERWLAEKPSFAMLDEHIAEGYDRRDTSEGCEDWLNTWQVARLVPDQGFMSGREFAKLFGGHQADALDKAAEVEIAKNIAEVDAEVDDALAH